MDPCDRNDWCDRQYGHSGECKRFAVPAVTETDPDKPHIPQPSDICSVCGNGLVHIDAHRDAPAVTEPDHERRWHARHAPSSRTPTVAPKPRMVRSVTSAMN